MTTSWDTIAARTGGAHDVEDFESAAYRVITEQVLYYADRPSRVAYSLIERFERDFAEALDSVGVRLTVNRQLRYAVALPKVARSGQATVQQTLLALVLRRIYDESARIGHLNDDGEVAVDLIELEQNYKLATGRDLPPKGEMDGLVRLLKRWGLVRRVDEASDLGHVDRSDSQPYSLMIRPAIADVLGESALKRLALWTEAASESPDALAEQQEEAGSEQGSSE